MQTTDAKFVLICGYISRKVET